MSAPVVIVTNLAVPPRARVVADDVFDAWSWCASDTLEWRRASVLDKSTRIDGANPAGLTFVMRGQYTFLPRELAHLHARGLGLTTEWALAPWAIDDATDVLYARRDRPGDVFWLAADNLAALVWGLHDWAHFHNHGPFDQPAMTELQCDVVAFAWLRMNAAAIGLTRHELATVGQDLAALSRRRFAEEGIAVPEHLLGDLHDDAPA